MNNSIHTLSLFSGGGLLDLGFINQGFQIEKSVEWDKNFVSSYNYSLSNYIKNTSKENILSNNIEFKPIEKEIDASSYYQQKRIVDETKGVAGIIGGPPCQDFSNGGKHKGIKGDRGKLLYSYLNIVEKVDPEFVFFENVPSLYSLKSHQSAFFSLVKRLQRNDYHVWYTVLNSLDFGIPQDRSRITLVGFKNKVVKKLIDNNYKLLSDGDYSDDLVFRWPRPKLKNPKGISWPNIWKFKSDAIKNEINLIPEPYKILTVYDAFKGLKESSPNQKEFFEPYSSRFKTVNEGDTKSKSFKRLHRYRYSPTVAYGNNEVHLHPTEARRLTVREALRLQSVPDNFVLDGNLSLSAKFKIISNGVPTKKAELIAKEIRRTIEIYNSLE